MLYYDAYIRVSVVFTLEMSGFQIIVLSKLQEPTFLAASSPAFLSILRLTVASSLSKFLMNRDIALTCIVSRN